MSYIIHGRCRSGSRWFWIAALMEYGDDAHKCDDPVCIYGGPHEYGWEDAEDLALKAMAEAVARLGGEVLPGTYRGNAPGSAGQASSALKRINAAKRAARPPSGSTDAGAVEYLYGAYISSWVDDMTGESVERVIPFQITRRTARRVYYIRRPGCPEWNDPPVIGFISRQELEADSRCPGGRCPDRCGHGYYGDHGDGPGEIRTSHFHDDDYHLFAMREAADEYLFGWKRERERKRKEREPELKQLRREMAAAHPDRGGTDEEFIAARERYEQALRRAS